MIDDFQAGLDAAFPAYSDANLVRAVREGILLADGTLQSEPFLNNLIGRDLRGHLRRAGILFRIHDMAQSGDLPFESRVLSMPRGSWHWVELSSGGFKAHACRSEGPTAFPEDTPTRQDDRLVNQFSLFDAIMPVEPKPEPTELCAWLTYSIAYDGSLGHLCWGMPNATTDAWLARSNVLLRLASGAHVPDPEKITKGVVLRFKDHVEDSLAKNRDHTRG